MCEIGIINGEIERLFELNNRVGDYLRAPRAWPRLIGVADVALEVEMRLCGRNMLKVPEEAPQVSMNPERPRRLHRPLPESWIEFQHSP